MSFVEACLDRVALVELRPTQLTVGYRQVIAKRRAFRAMPESERAAFVAQAVTPTVIGPGRRHYIIDQHHLMRALFEEGQRLAVVEPFADLSQASEATFWALMDERGFVHPFDAAGRRVAFDELPASVAELADDPYRSLAALVRRQGGFAKDRAPYSEFAWADFFRERLGARELEAAFDGDLALSLALARSAEASDLPGWRGAA